MNLYNIREHCLALRSWGSNGTATFNDKINAAINTAIDRISNEIPGACIPDKETVVLLEGLKTDRSLTNASFPNGGPFFYVEGTDQYVLTFRKPDGVTLPWTMFPLTGEWDGIMHIEVLDPDGVWHRRQCREFFATAGQGTEVYYRIALDRPWPNATDADMEVRIYQPYFYVRDDVTEVLDGRVWDNNQYHVLSMSDATATYYNYTDYRGETSGPPEYIIRGGYFQLQTPTKAPTVTAYTAGTWAGPNNRGTFRFIYTRVWGRKDEEWQKSPAGEVGIYDPQWESAPSPACAAFTISTDDSISIVVPEIDWMMNFNQPASIRQTHSGMRTRIYVARDAVSTISAADAHPNVESDGVFYLLAEIDGATTEYRWNGEVIPDYSRRLPYSHGYYEYRPYPQHDGRYELDLRVRRRPQKLVNDYDTPPIHVDALHALYELCLYYICLIDNDINSANVHMQNYEINKRHLSARYAHPAKSITGSGWGLNEISNAKRKYTRFSS